jgi:hypothetical protein
VSIYAVAEHHTVHTCPADPQPHAIYIHRRIINVTPGRACHQPVTIRLGTTTAVIPCWRHGPRERQCAACRTIITVVQVTITDLGHQAGTGQPAAPHPKGIAA